MAIGKGAGARQDSPWGVAARIASVDGSAARPLSFVDTSVDVATPTAPPGSVGLESRRRGVWRIEAAEAARLLELGACVCVCL